MDLRHPHKREVTPAPSSSSSSSLSASVSRRRKRRSQPPSRVGAEEPITKRSTRSQTSAAAPSPLNPLSPVSLRCGSRSRRGPVRLLSSSSSSSPLPPPLRSSSSPPPAILAPDPSLMDDEPEERGARAAYLFGAFGGEGSHEGSGNASPSGQVGASLRALHALLRSLSGGGHPPPPVLPDHSRLAPLIETLKTEQDESKVTSMLSDLCHLLSLGTEESIGGSVVEPLVSLLTHYLQFDHNPDIMLLACRALTYLMDAIPQANGPVVEGGAVPLLIGKLVTIQFIDLAEQALGALQKLSSDHSTAVLREGGLAACLMYVDFFPTGTQRTAVSTAANLCSRVPSDALSAIDPAIPLLTQLLHSVDQKVVEGGILCFSRLAESLCLGIGGRFSERSRLLTSHGLCSQFLRIISASPSAPLVGASSCALVVKTLALLVRASAKVAQDLLSEGIVPVLRNFLEGNVASSQATGGARSSELKYEILCLAADLLPSIPGDVPDIMFQPPGRHIPLFLARHLGYGARPDGSSGRRRGAGEDQRKEDEMRVAFLDNNPGIIILYGESLFPVLFQIYSSSINITVRHKCAQIIAKILHFSMVETLTELLRTQPMSSYVACLLSSGDATLAFIGLKMAEILICKLPDIFHDFFQKEGVVHEIEQWAKRELPPPDGEDTDGSQSTPEGHMGHTTPSVDTMVIEMAKHLHELFLVKTKGKTYHSPLLQSLKQTAAELEGPTAASRKQAMAGLATTLFAGDLSTFEFIHSGVVPHLLGTLTTSEDTAYLEEFVSFLVKGTGSMMSTLVRYLQAMLERIEAFHISTYENRTGGRGTELRLLGRPFKLRLVKAPDAADTLRDLGSNIVLIDPLATGNGIMEFLRTRLCEEGGEEGEEHENNEKERRRMGILEEHVGDDDGTDGMEEDEDEETGPFGDDQFRPEDSFDPENPGDAGGTVVNVEVESTSGPETTSRRRSSEPTPTTPRPRPSSSTASSSSQTHKPEFVITYNGQAVGSGVAMLELFRQHHSTQDTTKGLHHMWETIHTIHYNLRSVEEASDRFVHASSSSPASTTRFRLHAPLLTEEIQRSLTAPLTISDPTHDALLLLRVLWNITKHIKEQNPADRLPRASFVNARLTTKISRLLQDPLTVCGGGLPDWAIHIMAECSFLFPFEVRKLFLSCTTFGVPRALQAMLGFGGTDRHAHEGEGVRIGRIQRFKVRISRNRFLESAMRVLELSHKQPSVLEVEYMDEVGTGLGPTLEFYTIASREIQRRHLHLWMETETDTDTDTDTGTTFVRCPNGLYPLPFPQDANLGRRERVRDLFRFLGRFVAKALIDSRLVDMHLHPNLWRLLCGDSLTLDDIASLDRSLYTTLSALRDLVEQKEAIEQDTTLDETTRTQQVEALRFNGASVEALCLDFTLPGHPGIPLKPNGAHVPVTLGNLREYVESVCNMLLGEGVAHAVSAFRLGFEESGIPIRTMALFGGVELDELLCGCERLWDIDTVVEHTRCDHGYTQNSRAIKFLFEIMCSMAPHEQREFLEFLTGSPRLPLEGLKELHPKLTIVRRAVDPRSSPDDFLPSVMTCANYLKLPDYSSKDVMRERIRTAVAGSAESFHLS